MNWAVMMRTAVIAHGLSPQQFWQLSWREWVWLNPPQTPPQTLPCLSRLGLETLISQFPDI